ncbi:GNAT family N-acetyltransferase [Iningainema tapete]|uniref:GNAT family N-acetyltransferase n=1 Tax=Iningainema tapete BLCC-T55 TaxID=2748662 RepID=A0A8J6XFL6_9CYAN|nr:GNAT family N-acetyltransferase [Iningainema tapete BLCC-T55]
MPTIRTLQLGDEEALETFLSQHADTSMFLRSNLQAVGLVYQGAQFQGTYVAAIEDKIITAVAAHYWNGIVIVQAPVYLQEVVQAVVASSRAIAGIIGPFSQVKAATEVLGVANRPTQINEPEVLFSLALKDLRIPEALLLKEVECRLPTADELDLLTSWCAAYNIETLGATDTPSLSVACRSTVEARQANAMHHVLVAEGTLVSYSAFNARLPDIVQIGGVWTPPALRGQGYARCVLAGSLLDAQSQGVNRAILFTSVNNKAAQAVYRGLGFQPTGEEYGLLLFKDAAG